MERLSASSFLDFHRSLSGKGLIFSFTGYVSEGILFALGEVLKQNMALNETDVNVTKKVFSVFVEQAQNVIRYSADRIARPNDQGGELSSGTISVGEEGGKFFVVCANVVHSGETERLRQRLAHLAGMDKEQIKAYYREMLKEPPEETSKGASIGLIEIARRSSEPIQFDFLDLGNGTTFFCLKAFI